MIIWRIIRKISGIVLGPLRMIDYGDRFAGNCVMTFDDGPSASTIRVLDALKRAKVKDATFFVQGVNVKKHPQIVRRIVEDGHTLGNHSYNHPLLDDLSGKRIVRQLRMCQDAVNDALGEEYVLTQMRPPYGSCDERVLTILQALNLEVLLWQVDSRDFRAANQLDPDSIVHNVVEKAVRFGHGGLILFHDTHATTADIMPIILQRLASNGMKYTSAKKLLDRKYSTKNHALSSLPRVWRKFQQHHLQSSPSRFINNHI
jgi:peptidoglycan/xylan/chitin deacetylase (PgdA/CDA1 family)